MGFNYLPIIPPYYVALCASKAWHRLANESVSWCLETSLFLRLPSQDRAPSLPLLSLFLSFIFFLPPFEDNGLLFWVPDVLCQHSEVVFVDFIQRLNVLLMNLWGRKWSLRPIPLPSSGTLLTSYFCIPVPYNEKDICFGVLVLKGLVGLHSTVQLQFLQCYWLRHRLGLL